MFVQRCTKYYFEKDHERAPDKTRYQNIAVVKIVELRTGKELAVKTFKGSAPRYCQQREPAYLTEIWGDPVDYDQMMVWVKSFR